MIKFHKLTLTIAAVLLTFCSFAGNPESSRDPLEVSFADSKKELFDEHYQAVLRQRPMWRNFLSAHGNWYVHFDENNQKPHRAFGEPIPTSGSTPEERAWNFIENELGDFNIPVGELQSVGTKSTRKHQWVNFQQFHDGKEVLGSSLKIKMTHSGEVILFGLNVHSQIEAAPTNLLPEEAENSAAADMTDPITSVDFVGTQILPLPENRSYDFRTVHTIMVKTMNGNNVPSHYYTLVDAENGEILYRQNKVHHHTKDCGHKEPDVLDEEEEETEMNAEVEVTATVYPLHPYQNTIEVALGDLSVFADNQGFFTDLAGSLTLPITSGNIEVPLSGKWSTVHNGNGGTASFTADVVTGSNTFSFDDNASIEELNAFYHTNLIHNFMKELLPDFEDLDFAMPTNVEVQGECNAFFDGSSINFFSAGGGCNATSLIADVVYHEYAHGINAYYYEGNGYNFQNGAMHEGYADFWGMALTESPYIGVGFFSDSEEPLRRYDIDPKVYPDDIEGEVHADGQIICGAWYDTHVLLGEDWDLTRNLWVEAFNGFQAEAFNGLEGEAFTDVLIDVLQADDDDGDLSNGTPNGNEILEGFAIHGITLLQNAELLHDEMLQADAGEEIEVGAELLTSFDFEIFIQEVKLYYRTQQNSVFSSVNMEESDVEDFYVGHIPAQEEGTLIEYYLQTEDGFGTQSNTTPVGSVMPDPTLKYFMLVGFEIEAIHNSDFQNDFGNWTIGAADDNATSGNWEESTPVGSFSEPSDESTVVAPSHQHTEGGNNCFVTENATSIFNSIGSSDVDGGKTTLRTPEIDMSDLSNPAISYWRWYTNNPPSGANPNQDWWQVRISDDGGNSWEYIENTRTSDTQWRRNAFLVNDYIDLTDQVMVEFVASDSLFPQMELDGGSLVEAAVDDFHLYEALDETNIEEVDSNLGLAVFPNPATKEIQVRVKLNKETQGSIRLTNMLGETVYSSKRNFSPNQEPLRIPVKDLSSGIYLLSIRTADHTVTKQVSVN